MYQHVLSMRYLATSDLSERSNFVKASSMRSGNLTSHFISFSVQRKWKCRSDCQCICHVRRKYQSPAFLNRIIGILFMGYSGQPILGSCNNRTCQRHSSFSLDIAYYFPLWFLRRAIYIIAELSQIGNPTFGPIIRRVILASDPEYNFLKMIRSHDNQGVKTMIEGRYISPNDVYNAANSSALNVGKL